jgi:hypothetical protein
MTMLKRSILAVPVALAAFGFTATAPAFAQQQEGLVNVNITDVGVNVPVPVAVAANVCGVDVNVLAEQLPGEVSCDADARSASDNKQFMQFADRGAPDAAAQIREAAGA